MADEPISTEPNESSVATENIGAPEVETATTETTEVVTVPESPEPLDPQYVSRARMFNMTEEDLRTVPRETVERMIAGADKALIDAFSRDQAAVQAPITTPGISPVVAPAVAPADFSFDKFDVNFDPDEEVAEPITRGMKAMQEHSVKQFEKLHQHYDAKFKAVEAFNANTQHQQDYAILDRYIEGLGKEWRGVFGKGATLDMDPRSQEYLKRLDLRTAAVGTMEVNKRLTGRPLPHAEALPRALNSMFYEKASTIEREKADAKRKELQNSAAVRPRSGTTGLPAGSIRQRATELANSVRNS